LLEGALKLVAQTVCDGEDSLGNRMIDVGFPVRRIRTTHLVDVGDLLLDRESFRGDRGNECERLGLVGTHPWLLGHWGLEGDKSCFLVRRISQQF
jgi:hypothetical protein